MSDKMREEIANALSGPMYVNDYGEWVLPKDKSLDDLADALLPLLSSVKEDGVPSVPSVLGKEQGLSEASQQVAPPDLDDLLDELAGMRAREDVVGKRVAAGFMTCISGGGENPRVQIVFKELRDAQLLHDALLALENGHKANLAIINAPRVSDEHPSGRDLGLGAKPASAIREAETPVTPPAKGETR
ncbi:MAG TPA: hypothetical protein VEZ24_09555 [Microvirga sp.]|nr:hypothetical protein [Microvirga sp.]